MNNTASSLHIAIVSDAIYPYNIGGKEKRIYELSTRLAARGHHVTIYTMKWWKEDKDTVEYEGVTHKAISPLYPLYSGERRSIKEAIMFAMHCFKLINQKFDILDADHMPHLILFPLKLVCLVKRKKLFVTWNEVWGREYWVKYLGWKGHLAYLIEKISVMTPNVFISVSSHTTDMLKKTFHIKKPIYTIPLGIDYAYMKTINASKESSDIIFAGRLLTHKNINKLIEAIGVLKKTRPNIICRIVGNGPEEKNLKNLVKKLLLGKNVLFHDFLPRNEDIFSLIKASKVFVLPSSREGFGLSIIEATALGIPVLTYNYPQNAAKDLIIPGGNGYIFDNKNDIAPVLRKALSDTHSSQKIASYAKEYDWDIITGRVEEIYLNEK